LFVSLVKLLTGVNNGWFGGGYANDLGYNQFSGSELWHWPYDQPVPIDLSLPDPSPPRPLLTDQPGLIDQFFQTIQGVDIARIWLFERLEGIRFDASRKITGIDQELLKNLTAILDSANNHGVKVYLCLLDSWVVKSQPPSDLPQSRLSNYSSWNQAVRNIMKDIVNDPHDFTHNVLEPLVNRIANHPAVYAIDLMNEPEGMVNDTLVVSNSSMRNYVSQCSAVIRPRLKVSIGCMRSSTAKSYSNLPIDFCDFHSYREIADLEAYRPSNYNNKSCMIGECGYPVNNSNVASRGAKEVQVAEDYVGEALDQGYSSCLVWNQDFTSAANNTAITQWLRQFASNNNEVKQPPAPSSPFAAFIEWLIRLFGGSP
jgi:hypothetical protein